jgi:hypothetical protein
MVFGLNEIKSTKFKEFLSRSKIIYMIQPSESKLQRWINVIKWAISAYMQLVFLEICGKMFLN